MYVVLYELRRAGNIEYIIKTDHAEVVENWVFARAVDINSLSRFLTVLQEKRIDLCPSTNLSFKITKIF